MRLGAVRLFASLAVLALAPGCGGGGGDGDRTTTVELPPTPQVYSAISSNGRFQDSLGDVECGDREDMDIDPNTGMPFPVVYGVRGFVSFDLDRLPVDAEIVSATLTLVQHAVYGDPYQNLGSVIVDHVVYGAVLDPAAYSRSGPADAIAVLSSDEVGGPKTCDVTTAVENDFLSGRAYAQYRIRFPVEWNSNGDGDHLRIYSAASAATPDDAPRLVVVYR